MAVLVPTHWSARSQSNYSTHEVLARSKGALYRTMLGNVLYPRKTNFLKVAFVTGIDSTDPFKIPQLKTPIKTLKAPLVKFHKRRFGLNIKVEHLEKKATERSDLAPFSPRPNPQWPDSATANCRPATSR
jgi:hypothetical protein